MTAAPLARIVPTVDAAPMAGISPDDVRHRLPPPLRARHDRLRRQADREDFLAARALAAALVGERVGAPPADVRFEQTCIRCGPGDHGRPEVVGLPNVHVSWAHSTGVVAAAVAEEPIGMDVERIAAGPRGRETDRPLEPPPGMPGSGRTPWLAWARLEAVTKLGVADLDTALGWAAAFGGPVPSPPRARLILPDGTTVTLADGFVGDAAWAWAQLA